ncbi:unnamed protein product [Paramecium primaurelia]|uniref:Uncharacterized protein n=1 Tax=Paramecium primaurelia TaxID=5886 RepID=A0A8S1L704_PARPR|nr:unnamed protein product [Paramecium primaurelia]
MSPKNIIPFFNLTQIIVGIVAFSQGVQHLADFSIQYLYKDDFDVSPSRIGVYIGLSQLQWIIKPIWGIICDSFPILDSKRKHILFFVVFQVSQDGNKWHILELIMFIWLLLYLL